MSKFLQSKFLAGLNVHWDINICFIILRLNATINRCILKMVPNHMFHDNFVVYCCSIYYERLLKKINLSDFREVLNVLKYKEYYFMSLKTQL